jgi:hypothetical protein
MRPSFGAALLQEGFASLALNVSAANASPIDKRDFAKKHEELHGGWVGGGSLATAGALPGTGQTGWAGRAAAHGSTSSCGRPWTPPAAGAARLPPWCPRSLPPETRPAPPCALPPQPSAAASSTWSTLRR